MNRVKFPQLAFLLLVALALTALTPKLGRGARPQDPQFKPGEKIEYKAVRWPEKWEEGVVIKMLPGGTQVLIREKPNEFYKEGFERAYNLSEVRPRAARPAPTTPATTTGNNDRPPATRPERNRPGAARAPGEPERLMTAAEVLDYLRTRLGDQPFQHPQRAEIRQELGEEIKRRGVNFRYDPLSEFSNQLAKFGATSEIRFPLQDNYGPPTKQRWLMGAWSMDIIGAPVDVVRNNRVYRQGEGGAKGGVLTINPNGTYVWQLYRSDPPAKHVKGSWREATPEEMKYQGGAGIVLAAAKGSWDWIVMQDRAAPSGEWIRAAEITTRQVREFGSRIGGTK